MEKKLINMYLHEGNSEIRVLLCWGRYYAGGRFKRKFENSSECEKEKNLKNIHSMSKVMKINAKFIEDGQSWLKRMKVEE